MARRGPVDPRLVRFARSSRGFLASTAIIAVLQVACTIAFAWLLTAAITSVIGDGVTPALWTTLAILLGVVVVRALLVWVQDLTGTRAAASTVSELRAALMTGVRKLGGGWLSRQNSATLTVTAGHGLDALDVYVARFLPQLVTTIIATPVLIGVMWLADWPSGLTAALTLPLIPVFMVLIGLATRSVQRKQWETLGTLASRFADTVAGLATLRLFGRERRAVASIESISDSYRRETMRVLRITFLSGFMLEFLASIAVAIIAVTIGLRLLAGDMSLTVGLFVLLLAPEAFLPMRQVGVQFHAAAEGVAATEDVFAVLEEAAETPETDVVPAPVAAVLEVSDLVVRDTIGPISFSISAGNITLLEGASGSGKSSIIAALRGQATHTGAITADGIPVDGPVAMAWANQRPGLIAGTVAENVSLGDDLDDAAVAQALDAAVATAITPETVLGTQGAGLSGGQAQRVAVARALYRHARHGGVLVLDEPSSALDAETEAALWRNLRAIADAGAAMLLVSHRTTAREIANTRVVLASAAVERAS